ncbi:MAG: TetR/AcrR family transcriptional regulator [Candidatus Cloacimonetes bacterium]|jgi:AcrR family transcriptional regulator|nr:TetR/AcrR family transcriptional regulator [Candidatus Cloacimonadota bacterium]
MARIVKRAEERRNEILHKAQELFYKHGYTNTSVNMVIEALGISKGAFYHYFKSKEELLDCLSEEFTQNIITKIETMINNPNLNALEKLNRMYKESGNYKVENIDFIMTITEALYSDNNLLLRYKFNSKSVESVLPLMTSILQQGKDEGVFNIDDPQATARIVLLFGMSIAEYNAKLLLQLKDNPEKIDKMHEHFMIYQKSVERILGAPQESFHAFNIEFFEVFRTAYVSSK